MSPTENVRALLERNLDAAVAERRELDREIDAIRKAIEAFDGQRDRGSDGARPGRRHRGQGAPNAEVVPAGKLVALLGSSEQGLSTGALVEQTRGSRDQIRALLRELEAKGEIRRTGTRRGTRWQAITDEERIARRAAELERRSRAAAGPSAV